MENIFNYIEILLLVAAVVAVLCRRLHIPYTVGLVAAGLAIGIFTDKQEITLSKEIIFVALLPPLIFEAAFYLQWEDLKKNIVPVISLATIGVIISAGITALGMYYLTDWGLYLSVLFGTMICATDPVSVIATFKDTGVHGRLRLLVEAESLINDGAAAVLFGIVFALGLGQELSLSNIGITIVREIGGGILIGFIFAILVLWIAKKTEDHLVEITLTTVVAYGSFLIAQKFHCSGVLSTLICGLMLGNSGSLNAFSDKGRDSVFSFWEFAAFIANSLIFLLIGTQIVKEELLNFIPLIIIAFIISTFSRAIPVYLLSGLFKATSYAIEKKHQHILFWGGLRGALTLALALGLPSEINRHSEIVAVIFGTVALSIFIQGLTIPMYLKHLGLIHQN